MRGSTRKWSAGLPGGLALAWASLALADAPLVPAPVNTGFSDNPWSVHAVDLDGDGDLDVLSASLDDGEVNWFENDGASPPAFTPRHVTTWAFGPSGVSSADLDGDGDVDVLSADLLGSRVSWHENDGASPPAFSEHVIDTAVDTARAVVAADLDRDGDLDVVAASELGSDIAWYESDGASPPLFTRRLVVSGVSGATSVAAADVNGDGRLDVVSSSEHDDILAWHENDGASPPGFTRHVIYDQAQAALWQMPADVDGDGDVDVALASIDDRSVRWLENDGTRPLPGWTERLISDQEHGARSVFAADFDADGDVDLISAAEFQDRISWHESDRASPPGFTTHPLDDAALGASSVYAGDVDGDGDLDALSASFDDDTVRWFENRGIHRSARFEAPVTADPGGARAVRAVDLDTDGDLDLLLASPADARVAWLENDGASPPGFARNGIASGVAGAEGVAAGDLDGDGDVDVLSASPGAGELLWHESDGARPPAFTTRSVAAFGASDVAGADLDRDGDLDVVAGTAQGGALLWWRNDGAAPPAFSLGGFVSAGADGAGDLAVADLDRDGDPDVIAAAPLSGRVLFYASDGAATPAFSRHVVSDAMPGASAVRVGDLDGDGDLDLVSTSTQAHRVAWHENDGASPPGFTTHLVAEDALVANEVRLSDVDRDGDLDLVATASGLGDVLWYESDGGSPPAFSRHLLSSGCTPAALELADLDGDADPDVVCARETGPVAWQRLDAAQASLRASAMAGPELVQGSSVAVLRLSAEHRGRAGDGELEVAALGLRFEVESGAAMTTLELNALVSTLFVVRDDGSGAYEAGADAVALEFGGPITLVDGAPDVGLPDGAGELAVGPGETADFFAVLELKPGAASEAVTRLRVRHAPQQGTRLEDRSFDLPLRLSGDAGGDSGLLSVVASLSGGSDAPARPTCGLGPDLALLLPALLALRRRAQRLRSEARNPRARSRAAAVVPGS